MLIQDYLNKKVGEGVDPLAALTAELGIKVSPSKVHPSLISLKYSQTDSPTHHPIVKECRGLILDASKPGFPVVSRGFDRFFNAKENLSDRIDWSQATVQEKRDGSLLFSYVYEGELCFSSSSQVDLHEPLKGMAYICTTGMHRAEALSPMLAAWTLIFEITGPDNRVLIPYEKPVMTLLGIRDTATGYELSFPEVESIATYLGYPTPTTFPYASLKECEASLHNARGLVVEGYVVRSPSGTPGKVYRAKIKNPAWVAMSHHKQSPYAMVDVVRSGEEGEFLVYFPEAAGEFRRVLTRYEALTSELEAFYAEHGHLERKEFCIQAQTHPFSSVLIQVKTERHPDVKTSLRAMDAQKLFKLLFR